MSLKPTVVDGSFNINRTPQSGGPLNALTAIAEFKTFTVAFGGVYVKGRFSKGGTATLVYASIEVSGGGGYYRIDDPGRNVDYDFEISTTAVFPTSSNYTLTINCITRVSDGTSNVTATCSTVYEVVFPSTNTLILATTAPTSTNKRLYLLSNSLENGCIQSFKNTLTTTDEIYIATNNGSTIDGRNFPIQLRRSAGITLGRVSNNIHILTYYHGTLANTVYPFTIYRAWYGTVKGTTGFDVTNIIRNSYESGASGIFVNNSNMGGDPVPGAGKTLFVDYNDWNGGLRPTLTALENTTFNYSSMTNGSGTLNAIATNPTVVMNITRTTGSIIPISDGNKSIRLPDPSTNSVLTILGYSTQAGSSYRINVYANGNLGDSLATGFTLKPTNENACGVFLVSNGSKWYIVGVFAGTNTIFDTASESFRTQQVSTICLISTTDGCRVRDDTQLISDNTSALYFCKKAFDTNQFLIVNAPYNQVGSSTYKRFYRNTTTDRSAYLYIVTRLSSTLILTLPIAAYPSDV